MVLPFMTLYLTRSLHYSIGRAGIVMSLFGAGSIFGAMIGGKLTDKFGFYYIQMAALLCGGIFFILLGQMNSYPLICIFVFILSLFNDAFRPANSTAIAHYSKPENRTRSYSLNRLAINLGWAVGGAMGGFIASRNYHLLFWIDGLTNIFAAILLRAVLAPTRNNATPKIKDATPKALTTSPYRDKPYIGFIILTTLFAYTFFQIFSTIPVFYVKELHMSEATIGMVMAINGILIALFEMVTITRLEGRRHNLFYITSGTFVIGLAFIAFNVLPGMLSLAIIAMLLTTVGEMLSMPFMNAYWIGRSSTDNRGRYAALYSIAWSSAQVLGPGTGAAVAEYAGFRTLWWLIGGICMLTSAGYYLLRRYST